MNEILIKFLFWFASSGGSADGSFCSTMVNLRMRLMKAWVFTRANWSAWSFRKFFFSFSHGNTMICTTGPVGGFLRNFILISFSFASINSPRLYRKPASTCQTWSRWPTPSRSPVTPTPSSSRRPIAPRSWKERARRSRSGGAMCWCSWSNPKCATTSAMPSSKVKIRNVSFISCLIDQRLGRLGVEKKGNCVGIEWHNRMFVAESNSKAQWTLAKGHQVVGSSRVERCARLESRMRVRGIWRKC